MNSENFTSCAAARQHTRRATAEYFTPGRRNMQAGILMFGQKFGHLGKTKSLEEDKLGFPHPSLSTTRLHGQVYQQSRLYGGIV
jgi:hypothetical protein